MDDREREAIKRLNLIGRALNLLDPHLTYSWMIVGGQEEYITVELSITDVLFAHMPVDDAVKLLVERLCKAQKAATLLEKYRKLQKEDADVVPTEGDGTEK